MKYFKIIIPLIIIGCAGKPIINPSTINNDIISIIKMINIDRNNILKIRDRKYGSSGYYYILDNNGKVVFHPRALLIGRSFKKFWFIKPILKNRSGCFRFNLGNREHLIFFKEINNKEVLCLSISSEDVREYSGQCKVISSNNN